MQNSDLVIDIEDYVFHALDDEDYGTFSSQKSWNVTLCGI